MTSKADTALLLRAIAFAADRHRKKPRKDRAKTPYINHPIDVASRLANTGGVQDIDVLVAAVLHDTIEDTKTTADELDTEFGERVRSLVLEVTDDKNVEKEERKQRQAEHAPHLSPSAKLIKLADQTSNITDIALTPPHDWPLERRRDYVDWAERVAAGCRGVNPELDAAFDQALQRARKVLASQHQVTDAL
jgi:guanosine-3',5'-bis(diphosphate) 3'-pyrophosphohydrolase